MSAALSGKCFTALTTAGLALLLLGASAPHSETLENEPAHPRKTGAARGHGVDRGPTTLGQVALTFDLCSGPPPGKLDKGVIAALESHRARATFMVGGRWAEQDPARVERLLANPRFELESHSYFHPHLTEMSDAALRAELTHARDSLRPFTGRAPLYLRAPFGESDPHVVRTALGVGLTILGFDVASGDPDPMFDKKTLVRWVLSQVKPGSIVVFHANGRGWHTAEALPQIIEGLRARGLTLVTVGELLGTVMPRDPSEVLWIP